MVEIQESSFLTLGAMDSGQDELSYFRQILDDARNKAEQESYTERRAQEMAYGGGDDNDGSFLQGKDPISFIDCVSDVENIYINYLACVNR